MCPPQLARYKAMPYTFPIRAVATRGYERRARKLLSVAKSAKENLTNAEKREIRSLIAALEAQG